MFYTWKDHHSLIMKDHGGFSSWTTSVLNVHYNPRTFAFISKMGRAILSDEERRRRRAIHNRLSYLIHQRVGKQQRMKSRLGVHFSAFVAAALKYSKPQFMETFRAPRCFGTLNGTLCPFDNVIKLRINEIEVDHL